MKQDTLDILIVGGGLSGMSAYEEANRHGQLNVALVEYESQVGGELRFYPGFEQAQTTIRAFHDRYEDDLNVLWNHTAVGILPAFREGDPLEVSVSSKQGTHTVRTKTLLLCTGMFDTPRENQRIPGQRPAGVVTPSFAVRILSEGVCPGKNIVVYMESQRDVEAARVLKQSGANVTRLLVSPEVATRLAEMGAVDIATEILTIYRVTDILGRARLEGIRVETTTGEKHHIACDTLVYAGGRQSCMFALKGSDVEKNELGGIQVDKSGRTSIMGVYAAGTCVNLSREHVDSVHDGKRVMQNIIQTLSSTVTQQ